MFILLMGPPGAGKSTQAARLRTLVGVPHVATENLVRRHINDRTPNGRLAATYVYAGELVPSSVVTAMAMAEITSPQCTAGILLEGFPRTVRQAIFLDQALDRMGRQVGGVLVLTAPPDLLVERVTGRRICSGCGASYHTTDQPPMAAGRCAGCRGDLVSRSDDTAATARARFAAYAGETRPLLGFYQSRGLVTEVDGIGSPEEVTRRLRNASPLVAQQSGVATRRRSDRSRPAHPTRLTSSIVSGPLQNWLTPA
jgi:adenylate kinase